MSFFEDDLTDSDMKFLERFNQLGRSDTADDEYNPTQDELPEPQGEGDNPDVQGEVIADEGPQGGQGESDYDFDPDGEGETDSDEGMIDESKMDISDLETGQHEGESKQSSDEADEKDHLESGDSDSEIQDDESDLEYDDDDLYDEHDGDLDDEDNPYDDEDNRHEGEDDLDTENSDAELGGDDAKIEEDDGEGERGNSDEARESDEPIDGGDDPEEEPDDKGMTEDEAEEIINEKLDPIQETIDHLKEKHKQELNAESDSDFEGDAQQELEDHLRNEQDEPPKDEQKQSQDFSDLPEPGQGCDDHCEDNEEGSEHECPRCAERIMRERKEWGVIATDMHGNDIYVGDKVRVEIPMSFFTHGSMLTANVPNLEMDRWAVKTNGTEDREALWLSGKLISQFTGYHLHISGNPIWTFSKGRKLGFAEKIGEPEREGGGQGDIEDMIEELKQDLDEGKFDQENEQDLDEPENDEPELEENLDDEPEDDSEEQENKNGKLTATQLKRYENIFNRLEKKVAQTFGSTVESIESGPIYQTDEGQVARPIKVKSRGVEYHIVLVARRA